ncbi:MAG TPA: pilus assembly protein PilV [Noviherbaspirillum sp.]|jgi:type IV pilus assembly protein PilV|uniref:type IV pilus modification PilV family protein n=1 Tax=Noviherbaspirillum sp. TaxID=1926288 RepID=UPI002F94A65E
MHVAARRQNGIILVEALVAVLLFSLGILALVGLQATMSKNVTEAKLRSESAFLANQLIGQMWVDQLNLNNYAMNNGVCTNGGFANCTNWRTRVGQQLPNGSANVTIAGTAVNIQLTWRLPGEDAVPGQFEVDANITN